MAGWHVDSNLIAFFPTKTMLHMKKAHIDNEEICPESSSAVTELSVICHLRLL